MSNRGDGCSWLVFRWCRTPWAAHKADQPQRWSRAKFQTPPKTQHRSWLCWRAGEGAQWWRGRPRSYSQGQLKLSPFSYSKTASPQTQQKWREDKSTNFRGHVARNSNEFLTPPCQLHFYLQSTIFHETCWDFSSASFFAVEWKTISVIGWLFKHLGLIWKHASIFSLSR